MSKSSKSTKDKRDIYYRQSKAEGYRARSAFKLIHLDEQFGFLSTSGHSLKERFLKTRTLSATESPNSKEELPFDREQATFGSTDGQGIYDVTSEGSIASRHKRFSSPPTRVVDLCAAPGSWSQVLRQRLPSSSKIVSVDLQPMAPIRGITCIQGDITREETVKAVERALHQSQEPEDSGNGCRAELIVCDGAMDVTGVRFLDGILQSQLLLAALQISLRLLSPNGCFISKIFTRSTSSTKPHEVRDDGDSGALLKAQFKTLFEVVEMVKPISSRPGSGEHFLVCIGFRPPKGLGYGSDGETVEFVSLQRRAEEVLKMEATERSSDEETLRHVIPWIASGDLSGYNQT